MKLLSISLMAVLGGGCRSGSVADRAVATPATSTAFPSPAFSGFAPGTTSAERKARLEAIRPKLDAFFRASTRDAHATALAVGIVLDGELVYAKTFGVRDVVSNQPIDADTVFRIASMTKSFTATAVLKLRDEGRLSLDAPATTYLPELRSFVGLTRDAPPITVRMLLTHASGIAFDDYWGGDTFGMSDDELTRFMRAGVAISHAPGTRYQYSNLGYALLGRIVERVSGQPFRDYVTTAILRPLGMTSTVWEAGDVPPARLAIGYLRRGEALLPEPRPPDGVFAAAGGLYTSMRDFARYVAFNLSAYPPRDDLEMGPVRRSTLREMHDGQRWMRLDDKDAPVARRNADGIGLRASSYGFGWHNLTTCAFEGLVTHRGYEPGYFSNVVLLPEQNAGIFVLTTTGAMFGGVALGILREAGLLSSQTVPPASELTEAAGAINQLLDRWDPARVQQIFDRPSLGFSWLASLREDLAKLSSDHGRCHPDGALETHGPLRATWPMTCDRGSIEFDAIMTPAVPPRVQVVKWREEFPADPAQRKSVEGLLSMMRSWDQRKALQLFAPNSDLPRMRKAVTRLAVDHTGCVIESGVRRLDHEPMEDTSPQSIFHLKCDEGPLELSLGVDGSSGRIGDFFGYPPRGGDATCWQ